MACVADENEIVALSVIAVYFVVDFDDERASRIDDVQPSPIGFRPDRLRHTMRAENYNRAFRNFAQLFHEHSSLLTERIHDMSAMHDFVPHIDRRTVSSQR